MFKKLTALLLVTVFTNVYAVTPVVQSRSIDATFDALNYKLNVEWDQKDTKFFDSSIAEFEKEIVGLQDQGLSTKDLLSYTVKKIKDPKMAQEINEMAKIVADQKMSDKEARAFVLSKLSSTYSHGASWSGSRVGAKCGLFVGLIVLIVITARTLHEVEEIEDREEPTPPNYGCDINYGGLLQVNTINHGPLIICEPTTETLGY